MENIEGKEILIIDEDKDFCLLMQFYFTKKKAKAYYSQNLMQALELVETRRPAFIIAGARIARHDEYLIEKKMQSMGDYFPLVQYCCDRQLPDAESEYSQFKDDLNRIAKWVKDKLRL